MSEVAWTKLFAYDVAAKVKVGKERCACGGKNCRTAKHIKCVCRCHSEFHGAANRKGMSPLDDALGLMKEAPKSLGDLVLKLEFSGRLGQ